MGLRPDDRRRTPPGSPPRSAYVHVPFCDHRCGYCNFTLVANRDDLIENYLSALLIELQSLHHPRRVDTLFIGGGTPTYLPPAILQKLLEMVCGWFPLAPDGEFSIEANPGDITNRTGEILARAGITRVSLGAQSFSSAKLRLLERKHLAKDVERAVHVLKKYNIDISIDLIFGAPNETFRTWKNDLSKALDLNPNHLSTYGLTYEKGSLFYGRMLRRNIEPVNDVLELKMYEFAIDHLQDVGFEHYEVSSFSLPGYRCRHNEVYWMLEHYFAIGPGASRFIDGTRSTNHRSTTTYIKRLLAGSSPVAFAEHLSPEESAREAIVFGLRRLEGISLDNFRTSTGFDIPTLLGESLNRILALGLLSIEDDRIKLTRKGLLVSDAIWPEFLAA